MNVCTVKNERIRGFSMKNVVNNLPEYAKNYQFWVCTEDDKHNLWFYGAWSDRNTANHIAQTIGGCVIENN